MTEAVAELI